MMWHRSVIAKLEAAQLFVKVALVGGKVRATIDADRFLDVHYDPDTKSYSYAVIDTTLPFSGDKRLFGWDDFPHPSAIDLIKLPSYPHHFQIRVGAKWIFEDSPMRGDVEAEIDIVIAKVSEFRQAGGAK